MSNTVTRVHTESSDGEHTLIVTDDQGAEHRFIAAIPVVDLIRELDTASVGIRLSPDDNYALSQEVWEHIHEQVADVTLLDPNYEEPVSFDEVTTIELGASKWDNGYFPNGQATFYRGKEELITRIPENRYDTAIQSIYDGELRTELRELGWRWDNGDPFTMTRPEAR